MPYEPGMLKSYKDFVTFREVYEPLLNGIDSEAL
jgi:hypothetical protein